MESELKVNRKMRIILTTFIVLLIIYFIVSLSFGKSENLESDNIKKQSYKGYIVEKFIDKPDHFGNKIILKNGNKQPIHWKFSVFLEVGDSVLKKEGDSFVTVYKKDGELITYDLVHNKIQNEK
ncbi:hypothetical protein EKL97_05710 [Flavobacterium sp. LS1P28]|uniref:hypothetical protein n=1 Tax=Flavobacterium sp. LS1P28 TaxID=2497752 RepID=UPI000F846E40|nr:hypothetical protein [Flavobacterium sp. LS1P28]RTY83041.1 hypothetical protein EKL97_05710 [Flavobacterium sp. LS1P28]